jgi:hypothetical protein
MTKTSFYVLKRTKQIEIWRTKDEKWNEECMEVAAAGSGRLVNFWSAITTEGTGFFRIYYENTGGDVYCDILNNYLIPTVHMYQMDAKISILTQ